MRTRTFLVALVVLLLGGAVAACSDDGGGDQTTDAETPAEQSAPNTPTVSGPVPETTGAGIQSLGTDYDFESVGYVREEYLFEGEAVGYEQAGELASDGEWEVTETGTAPFMTRMIVVKPVDPAAFSGTVVVEWFNVTGGVDAGPAFINGHNWVFRTGAAWVGVTAQAVGVTGSEETVQSDAIEIPEGGLVNSDPERYGDLSHPGDLYAYDIFTQAGVAVSGDGDGIDPFEGYDVQRVVAVGESQSAGRLTTYVNAVQPVVGQFDGFLIFSRGATSAPFGERIEDVDDPNVPDVVQIREDTEVPVFTLEAEYDVDALEYADARQPDSENFRLWEVAGTSHQDSYTGGGYSLSDLGDGAAEVVILDPASADGGLLGCVEPINAGALYAPLQAAMSHLEAWVRDGAAPPEFPILETTGEGVDIEMVRDDLGIAEGGVRTPIVEVPLAVNVGDRTNSPDFCSVFGHTTPLDAAALADLYPNGSADYREAFETAVDQAVEDGIWLEPEAENFKAAARQLSIG